MARQYYIPGQQEKKCVINSNRLSEEMIRKFAVPAKVPESERLHFPGESSDGFRSGLNAQKVEVEQKPDPEEVAQKILSDAREKADQILNDADTQAKELMQKTKEDAEAAFEEQKELGYAEGAKAREEELAELERGLEEQRAQLLEETNQRKTELESEFNMRMEELEGDIVDALIPVFDKVFHIQFEDQREILLALVNNTLMNVEVGNKVRIRTSENDKELLREHLDEIREHAGADVSIELLQDMRMEDGQCQIETNYGVFDCGIDTQFTNLIKEIRSLI